MRIVWLLVWTATFGVSCAKERGPTPFDTVMIKASLDSLWTRYATAADQRDSTAFGSLFTEDAALVFSGAPTKRGREAIQGFLASLYSSVDATGFRVHQEDLQVSGGTAVQSGSFEEEYIEAERTKTEFGRFVLVAERIEGDAWRIRHLVTVADSTRE